MEIYGHLLPHATPAQEIRPYWGSMKPTIISWCNPWPKSIFRRLLLRFKAPQCHITNLNPNHQPIWTETKKQYPEILGVFLNRFEYYTWMHNIVLSETFVRHFWAKWNTKRIFPGGKVGWHLSQGATTCCMTLTMTLYSKVLEGAAWPRIHIKWCCKHNTIFLQGSTWYIFSAKLVWYQRGEVSYFVSIAS